jgi:hypothetical protein
LGNPTFDGANRLQQFSPLLFDLQNHFLQVRVLAEISSTDRAAIKEIELVSKHALIALDYALFAVDALQTELPLTSVSAAAAAQDVAENLRLLAKAYDVELELDISNRLEPVYANEAALKGVLYGLASSLITASGITVKRPKIVIAAQGTTPKVQRLGVYSPNVIMPSSAIKQARQLAGKVRFLAPKELHHAGLGLVVSDQLAQALGSRLRQFTHRGQRGIGFYVPMSGQLGLL